MSTTYGLGCHRCRKYIWIGQRTVRSGTTGDIYGTDSQRKLQRRFLYAHIGHPLEFETTDYFYAEKGYDEIPKDGEDE